jgi:hypothetical protein
MAASVAEGRKVFGCLDPSGSGLVSLAQFGRLLQRIGSDMPEAMQRAAVSCISEDGSGRMDIEEFLEWWTQPQVGWWTQRLSHYLMQHETVASDQTAAAPPCAEAASSGEPHNVSLSQWAINGQPLRSSDGRYYCRCAGRPTLCQATVWPTAGMPGYPGCSKYTEWCGRYPGCHRAFKLPSALNAHVGWHKRKINIDSGVYNANHRLKVRAPPTIPWA